MSFDSTANISQQTRWNDPLNVEILFSVKPKHYYACQKNSNGLWPQIISYFRVVLDENEGWLMHPWHLALFRCHSYRPNGEGRKWRHIELSTNEVRGRCERSTGVFKQCFPVGRWLHILAEKSDFLLTIGGDFQEKWARTLRGISQRNMKLKNAWERE